MAAPFGNLAGAPIIAAGGMREGSATPPPRRVPPWTTFLPRPRYPLIAPAMIPSMKRRWKRRKIRTIGSVPMNEPAMTAPYSWL